MNLARGVARHDFGPRATTIPGDPNPSTAKTPTRRSRMILGSEFLEPLALTSNRLAEPMRLRAELLEQLPRGERGVTADDALRLAGYFGATPEFWQDLQAQGYLKNESATSSQPSRHARQQRRLGDLAPSSIAPAVAFRSLVPARRSQRPSEPANP